MTVSTSTVEPVAKPADPETVLALTEPTGPQEPELLTYPETSRKYIHYERAVCKSLNLRVGLERYEWFKPLKVRLGRPTNEKILQSRRRCSCCSMMSSFVLPFQTVLCVLLM